MNSEKPLFAKKSLPQPKYGGEDHSIARTSIPLIFLVLAVALYTFFVRPWLVEKIPEKTKLFGVEVFFAAVIIVIYAILTPLFGGKILTGKTIMDTISSILGTKL